MAFTPPFDPATLKAQLPPPFNPTPPAILAQQLMPNGMQNTGQWNPSGVSGMFNPAQWQQKMQDWRSQLMPGSWNPAQFKQGIQDWVGGLRQQFQPSVTPPTGVMPTNPAATPPAPMPPASTAPQRPVMPVRPAPQHPMGMRPPGMPWGR